MLTDIVQRWRDRRDSYRPAGEPIDTRRYEVAPIDGGGADTIAKAFVVDHHYSGAYPAARFRFGLYRAAELVGVAVYSVPCNSRVLTSVFPVPVLEATELGRFVLLDDVPANGETWFIARTFEHLRRDGVAGVVMFSDPVPRATSDGRQVFPGHIGTIYQASNAVYLGRGDARTLRLLPDGRVFSHRAEQKIRQRERGYKYAIAQLLAAGAREPGGEDPRAWLRRELPRVTRPLRHRGNHKYAIAIDRRLRKALPTAKPYPKLRDKER